MKTIFYVDLEQSTKNTYDEFIILYYTYEDALRLTEDYMLKSDNFENLLRYLDIAIDTIIKHTREVELFGDKMEQYYLLVENYAKEAIERSLKVLDHPLLYNAYQNLSGLKNFMGTVSGSNIYKEFSFAQWINKARLQEMDLAYINLKRQYYQIEKRIIDTLLLFEL